MPFDIERFEHTKMQRRTEDVPVPDLAAFFEEDEPRVWTIQTLTAAELCRCNEAKERAGAVGNILEAVSLVGREQIDALRKALGMTKDVPGEIAKRVQLLVEGSVMPKVTHSQAVLLSERYGTDFYMITNKILILAGSGFDLVKPAAASQQTPDSSPACESPSSGAAISTSTDPT